MTALNSFPSSHTIRFLTRPRSPHDSRIAGAFAGYEIRHPRVKRLGIRTLAWR